MSAIHRGEDQGVHHSAAPTRLVILQAHPAEVGLAFGARLAVCNRDCHGPAGPAVAQHRPARTGAAS
jgi:hypothetical protein